MKRLTGYDYIAGVRTGDLLVGVEPIQAHNRLAAYEDIDLEPEEIEELKARDKVQKMYKPNPNIYCCPTCGEKIAPMWDYCPWCGQHVTDNQY